MRMKRIIAMLLVLVLAFAMLGSAAYADSGAKNVIKKPGQPKTESVVGSPSADDIKRSGDSKVIQMPKSTSYLDSYEYKFLDSGKKQAVNSYKEPYTTAPTYHYVYKGTMLRILAEEGDWVCAQYLTHKNEFHSAWIHSSNLSDKYPGLVEKIGTPAYKNGDVVAFVQPDQEWSKTPFVDSETDYTIIGEPWCDEGCMGLAIDYQVISRNGISRAYGDRDIYLNGGDGWEYIGSFEVLEDFTPQRIEIEFKAPVVIKAVAVVPAGNSVEGFIFRQHVQDMKFIVE